MRLPLCMIILLKILSSHAKDAAVSMKRNIVPRQSFTSSSNGLKPRGQLSSARVAHERFLFKVFELPLRHNRTTEDLIDSWCTKKRCRLSPRSYFHPVSFSFSILGFTNGKYEGNVWFLDDLFRPFLRIKTLVNGSSAIVAGLYGFHDRSFAAMLYVDAETITARKMWLQFYRPDNSVKWTTLLNSPISVPDRNVGDFRLTYGKGYFMAYFSVFGISNFANGSNGDQVSFIDENGKVKTTNYNIPGQKFVKTGDIWGCSHSLGQLAAYHQEEGQFTVVCSGDHFPKGISAGESDFGALIFRADVDGRGSTSAQLGQIAESDQGFKILFNAESSCVTELCECCPAQGIGFTTIYNDRDRWTDRRDIDEVLWLTATNGTSERDPVITRMYIGSNLFNVRERFLVGWHDVFKNEFVLGIVNKFGKLVKPPTSMSEFAILNGSTFRCESHCVAWGNRDDSFKTLTNGHVGWVYAPSSSKSIWVYEVSIEGIDAAGWSLWSGWARCSRSCGGGVTTRVRSCLSISCSNGERVESKMCNAEKCKIPLTCIFNYTINHKLEGDLIINSERVFGFTFASAQEKCILLRDFCHGITEIIVDGVPLYFLRTGTNLLPHLNSNSKRMECTETPGWSKWSTWFACTASCGSGTQIRRRFCDGGNPGSNVCPGMRIEEMQFCNTGRCPYWSEWSAWSVCSKSCDEGSQRRSRMCAGDYPNHCESLRGQFDVVQRCLLGSCPHWSSWSSWSACSVSCGTGSQFRSRICSGDFPCSVENETGANQNKSCFLGKCAYWSEWQEWSSCSDSCGNSTRRRIRQCLGNYNFEKGCPLNEDFTKEGICNLGVCPYWSSWENWGACSVSCGTGITVRNRRCLGDFSQQFCDIMGDNFETIECSPGECGYLSDWNAWGECSVSCNDGTQKRFRQCLGDFPCSLTKPVSEKRNCNYGTCPSWGVWFSWGPCSVTCGMGGFRRRLRFCIGDFPDFCQENDFWEKGSCDSFPKCPKWDDWSSWSVCSKTCDSGIMERSRRCKAIHIDTCNRDTESSLLYNRNVTTIQTLIGDFVQIEKHQCSRGLCSYWLDWITWSGCSSSCDRGFQTRFRKCFGDFTQMCYENGEDSETRFCSIGRCGYWDHWMAWGQCSKTCGPGVWSRRRKCLGDFPKSCIGPDYETSSCDIADCIDVCMPNPCTNGGICRRNNHLTRLYHCVCQPGWMGRHCNLPGPEVLCGSDNIVVSFDRKVVEDEKLVSDDPSLVSLVSRDSVACTAMFDHFNFTEYYLIVAPSPIEKSCGSYMEVSPSSYMIRNQVIWQVEDINIRSTVVLIDFTCMYLKNVSVSSSASASDSSPSAGILTVDSFHREVKLVTANGTFDVDISLYRDPNLEQMIFPGRQSSLVSLAEGEVVYVSVDLRSQNLLPFGDAALVLNNCFVTSLQSNQEPMVHLIQNSCPTSAFVTVLSNGNSRSARFMVRVFGWTGKRDKAEDVFIHCAVNVCNRKQEFCVPDCGASRKKKRSITKSRGRAIISQDLKDELNEKRKLRLESSKEKTDKQKSWQTTSLSPNGHPYIRVINVVASGKNGRPKLNFSRNQINFDASHMVSVGPLEVILKLNSRKVREIDNLQNTPHISDQSKSTTSILLTMLAVLFVILAIKVTKRFF